MAMLYKGDEDGAIVNLSKAIQYAELDPTAVAPVEVFFARRSRATLYDRKRMFDAELADLNAMIEGYWKWPTLSAALRATYQEQGTATLIASVYRMRALVHMQRRDPDSAIADLSLALQLDNQRSLQYLLERGRIQEAAGRRGAAILDYQQALRLNPANAEARAGIARLNGSASIPRADNSPGLRR
jgi:tetratricopeptide (TPR) repeat protein